MNKIDLAFQEKEHLQPMGNLDGSVTISNEDVVHKAKRFVSRLRKGSLSSIRSQSVDLSSGVYDFKKATFKNEEEAPYLLVDSKYNESGTFSTHEIRQAFLRFMVSLLKKYPTFIYIEEENEVTHQRGGPRFDELAFLKDFNDISAKDFMTELISSQVRWYYGNNLIILSFYIIKIINRCFSEFVKIDIIIRNYLNCYSLMNRFLKK